jgi:hypothetical protein
MHLCRRTRKRRRGVLNDDIWDLRVSSIKKLALPKKKYHPFLSGTADADDRKQILWRPGGDKDVFEKGSDSVF